MVLILDTNVLSALMEPARHPVVVNWLDRQSPDVVFTTAVSIFEVRYGLGLLPVGKRRKALETLFAQVVDDVLERRVLAFDTPAAHEAGQLMAWRQAEGRPVGTADTQIAAIARLHEARVVTRNGRHFADAVPVVDPWQDDST